MLWYNSEVTQWFKLLFLQFLWISKQETAATRRWIMMNTSSKNTCPIKGIRGPCICKVLWFNFYYIAFTRAVFLVLWIVKILFNPNLWVNPTQMLKTTVLQYYNPVLSFSVFAWCSDSIYKTWPFRVVFLNWWTTNFLRSLLVAVDHSHLNVENHCPALEFKNRTLILYCHLGKM